MEKELLKALDGILNHNEGSGCPMCDNGKLRDPNKEHWDDCAWNNARKVYEKALKETGWRDAKTIKPEGYWGKGFHKHLSEDVLIINRVSINIGRWNRDKHYWEVDEPVDENWIDDVTHWMPLPNAPYNI